MAYILKFPEGEFTADELAKLNNKEKPAIWVKFQESVKSGDVVIVGKKNPTGRGKPSNIYKVVLNETIKEVFDAVEKMEDEQPIVHVPVELKKQSDIPEKSLPPMLLEAVKKLPLNKDKETPVVPYETLDKVCPICNHNLVFHSEPTGFFVFCNQKINVCKCPEQPFGFNRTISGAYEVLMSRWGHNKKQ